MKYSQIIYILLHKYILSNERENKHHTDTNKLKQEKNIFNFFLQLKLYFEQNI